MIRKGGTSVLPKAPARSAYLCVAPPAASIHLSTGGCLNRSLALAFAPDRNSAIEEKSRVPDTLVSNVSGLSIAPAHSQFSMSADSLPRGPEPIYRRVRRGKGGASAPPKSTGAKRLPMRWFTRSKYSPHVFEKSGVVLCARSVNIREATVGYAIYQTLGGRSYNLGPVS